MSVIDDWSRRLSKTTQDTVKKTQDFAEIAKINSQISEEQKNIRAIYLLLGEKYYEIWGRNPEVEFAELCDKIARSQTKIDKWKKELQVLKNVKVCPNCGAEYNGNLIYCGVCGNKMPEMELPSKKYCLNCHMELEEEAVFCPYCGTKN